MTEEQLKLLLMTARIVFRLMFWKNGGYDPDKYLEQINKVQAELKEEIDDENLNR